MAPVIAAVVGYLIGSIPFGLILGRRLAGVDVRDYGSGKTGFTNTLRVLGARRSLPVFLGDFGKGLIAATLPLVYSDDPWAQALGGLGAICGHVWPLFAGFRGGRGVLTGAGALFAFNPLAALAVVPLAALTILVTRYVSLGSIVGAAGAGALFLVLAALDQHDWAFGVVAAAGCGLIIALHHDNIGRLIAGTERKLGQGGDRRTAAR